MNVATWGDLYNAIVDYNRDGVIRKINLAADIDGTNETQTLPAIADNGDLTLNLGANTLKTNGTLVNNGNLTITNVDGYLIGPGSAEAVRNNKTMTLVDGQIDGNGATAMVNNGTFTMSGGELIAPPPTGTNATFVALENAENATAAISGGRIWSGVARDWDNNVSGTHPLGVANHGDLTISGSAVLDQMGQAIRNMGALTMTGGTISAENGEFGIYMQGGTAELSGGTITSDIANIGPDTQNAVGVAVVGGELILNGATINAYAGQGMQLNGGTTTFQSGTITASVNANAVTAYSADYYDSTITATIRAVEEDTAVFSPMPEGYAALYDGTNYFVLTAVTEEPVYGDIYTWADFVDAVAAFNGDNAAMNLTLQAAIPAENETDLRTLEAIANNGAALTINMNGKTLNLPQALTNNGNLIITGRGAIKSDTVADTLISNTGTMQISGSVAISGSSATTMISNTRNIELAGGSRITLSAGQTGIANTNGIVTITSATIQQSNGPSTGISSNGGTVNLNGGEIILGTAGNRNYGINATNATVNVNGGTIRESVGSDYSVNHGVYADGGTLNLTSGSIEMNYGTAVGVSTKSVLTLDAATVTGIEPDNLLVADDKDTTGYAAEAYEDTYYVLVKADSEVDTWTELVAAVNAFNDDSEPHAITFAGPIVRTAEEANVTMPAIGAAGSTSGTKNTSILTIDQKGFALTLPQTLTNEGSLMLMDSNPGQSAITSTLTGTGERMIVNNGTMTWNKVVLQAEPGIIAVDNSDTFDMNQSTMKLIYTTGIQNSGTVNLNDGSIALFQDDTYENGAADAIGYMAYTTIGTGAKLNMDGTIISIEQGINYTTNGDYSPPAGIYNDRGNTVKFTDGTITVGSGVGISNHGTLTMSGGTVKVNEAENAQMDAATGIESFGGTFEMTNGAVEVTKGTGIRSGGGVSLKGGTVTITENANAASCGVSVMGATEIDGTDITANTGYGVRVDEPGAALTLGTDTVIDAYGDAYAVTELVENGAVLTRPVKATITYTYTNDAEGPMSDTEVLNHLVGVADQSAMSFTAPVGDTTTTCTLADNYGSVVIDTTPVRTAQEFAERIAAFNNGGGDTTITLGANISVPDETDTTYVLPAVDNDLSDLTIDLAGYTLTLGRTLVNNSSLMIADNTSVDGYINGTAETLIENNGTLTVGDGTAGYTPVITANATTAIHAAGGTVTLNGMDVKCTSATQTVNNTTVGSTGVKVDNGANLIVTAASFDVLGANSVGIDNSGTAELNGYNGSYSQGAGAGSGGGTMLKNQGTATMNGGTLTSDRMSCVDNISGTFTMNAGTLKTTSNSYAAVNAAGGTVNLAGGTLTVNTSSVGGEIGVEVSEGAVVNLSGTDITATGSGDYADKTYGIYHWGGTVNIIGGSITAASGAIDPTTGSGNAYALYSRTADRAGLMIEDHETLDRPAALIRANIPDLAYILYPAEEGMPYTYGEEIVNDEPTGYYYLCYPN